MTPEQTLDKYRNLVVVNANRKVHELSVAMRKLPESEQAQLMARSELAGAFWLYRDPANPGMVLEIVYSFEADDYISALYMDDSNNSSKSAVLAMREELITAISQKKGLSPELMGVTDEGRGREIGLNEMTSGQLVDMLNEQFGSSIVVADNVGGNLSLMQRIAAKFRLNR